MTKTSEDKWRGLIAAQEKSGISVREFAASHRARTGNDVLVAMPAARTPRDFGAGGCRRPL